MRIDFPSHKSADILNHIKRRDLAAMVLYEPDVNMANTLYISDHELKLYATATPK